MDTKSDMDRLDLVVIGAGWYGLAAAKHYHMYHRAETIAILDGASSVGGVWSRERLYPGLRSNNLLGTYEYPDFPMDPETYGVQPGEHIPGEVIHRYLKSYAEEFDILQYLRLNTKVLTAEHIPEGGWILHIQETAPEDEKAGSEKTIFARRLVLATGNTSQPFLPHVRGQETFGRPLFHSKDFGRVLHQVHDVKRVTVFGGSKSAWDAVYAYASQGIKVDWVIRESGHGPVWMAPPFVTPFKAWLEKLVNMRALHWFSPCVWGKDSGYTGIKSFWQTSSVGRAVTGFFWKTLAADVLKLQDYDSHPEMKKLKPTCDAMFTGTSFSIMNYETDFFEYVRNGTVNVFLGDLSHLTEGQVHLDDEHQTVLDSDAMICATGWKHLPSIQFLPDGIEARMGFSVPSELADGEILAADQALMDKADFEIGQKFPILLTKPSFNPHYVPLTSTKGFSVEDGDFHIPTKPQTPMMLYRFTVPAAPEFLRTKDFAIAGGVQNFSNTMCAHVQGLWINAYFEGKLLRDPSAAVLNPSEKEELKWGSDDNSDVLSLDRVRYETVLHNRFGKWRYPNDRGAKHPDFVFEAVPYIDMLMADMGLKVHRKNGWFAEMTSPYGPEDYRNMNAEWSSKFAVGEV